MIDNENEKKEKEIDAEYVEINDEGIYSFKSFIKSTIYKNTKINNNRIKNKISSLFFLIFLIAYIITGSLTNNFGTPNWLILMGIPISRFILNSIFNKFEIFQTIKMLLIIAFVICGILTSQWGYSALILLGLPLVSSIKSLVSEVKRRKNNK